MGGQSCGLPLETEPVQNTAAAVIKSSNSAWTQALVLTSSATLSKLPTLSEPWFPHTGLGGPNSTHLAGLLGGLGFVPSGSTGHG